MGRRRLKMPASSVQPAYATGDNSSPLSFAACARFREHHSIPTYALATLSKARDTLTNESFRLVHHSSSFSSALTTSQSTKHMTSTGAL